MSLHQNFLLPQNRLFLRILLLLLLLHLLSLQIILNPILLRHLHHLPQLLIQPFQLLILRHLELLQLVLLLSQLSQLLRHHLQLTSCVVNLSHILWFSVRYDLIHLALSYELLCL